MTSRDLSPPPPATLGRPSREGEIVVSWIRLAVSGIILALLGFYLLQDVEQIRAALIVTGAAAACWAAFSAATIVAFRRRPLPGVWSLISITTDIGFVTVIQLAHLDPLPLNFANGPITDIYFVLIGLAAIRGSHRLVLFSGLVSGATHLAFATAFFAAELGRQRIATVIGDIPIEINYLDEVAKGTLLAMVGSLLALVTRNLLAAERHTHDLFEHVPDGILIVDGDRRVLTCNLSFSRMAGIPTAELEGRPLADFLGHDPSDAGSIPPPGMLGNPTTLRRADGTSVPVRTVSAPVEQGGRHCLALSIRDVTGQIRLRRKVTQSQKMETLGRLSGGLARDLSRILEDTLAGARALSDELDGLADERAARALARQASVIHDCATRAKDVAARLRTFSHDLPASTSPVDLHDLVQSVARICRNSFAADIGLITESAGPTPIIEADGTALTQALLNLCVNARDAIAARGDGTGSIRLALVEGAPPHGGWVIEVTDDGCGIDEDIAERIYDPFFTTKPPGKGTGLGLSLVYGVARQHGGSIVAESSAGAGSTFRLWIPAASPQAPGGIR